MVVLYRTSTSSRTMSADGRNTLKGVSRSEWQNPSLYAPEGRGETILSEIKESVHSDVGFRDLSW